MNTPTPHIEVVDKNKIAKTVLMPGDPLRAKFIAEKYLENVEQINGVRNMLAYTGTYKDKKVTIFASGMGMPSIGIYSYELYKFYDVENIIRIGSCGAYNEKLNLYDIILVKESYSESSYAKVQYGEVEKVLQSSSKLNDKIIKSGEKQNIKINLCRVHSSDVFYGEKKDIYIDMRDKNGCDVVEMESFALFANAKLLNKKATCLLTVSDSIVNKETTTSEEREKSFTNMMKVALESIV